MHKTNEILQAHPEEAESMNVGCVTHHNYPTGQEVRTTKIAATLQAHDYGVVVFCPGARQQATRDAFEHGHIVRFRPWAGGVIAKLFAPLPISPLWAFWLLWHFRAAQLDLIVVRDLRLALPVYFAAKILRIPVVLDIGEHYPGMMRILGKEKLAHHLIRNDWLITRLEALSVKLADRVWVVVEENKQRLASYSSKIDVINNYPALVAGASVSVPQHRPFSPDGEPVTLISLGLIDNIRGLDLAIEAFALVAGDLKNVRLVIYGDGFFREMLEAQVHRLGLQDKVHFGGWVDADQKYEVLAQGDIGLLLHTVCDLTQHTVPNKLFDYMYVGLPVLSTKLLPVTRILETEKCGVAVDETSISIAEGMKALILDHSLRGEFSINARDAVHARYRWETEAEKIYQKVNSLLGTTNSEGQHP